MGPWFLREGENNPNQGKGHVRKQILRVSCVNLVKTSHIEDVSGDFIIGL